MIGGNINKCPVIEFMNGARENIIGRLRRDLAPAGDTAVGEKESLPSTNPESLEIVCERFTQALQKVGGRVIRCKKEELPAVLSQVFSSSGKVYIEPVPALHDCLYGNFLVEKDSVQCEGGITTCDALIAETGTVVLSGGEVQKRIASLVTRLHCVIAHAQQFITTLDEYISRLQKSDAGWSQKISALTFITGPSRTADIEKVLIQGMHGPGELVVVILD
jgi:L-lactate dehydrogenase complex protein LldG